jgi:branched-chain amino acid transport system ATP-binding protein
MLAIGRALMTNPVLLLMDEPSEGLAPLIVRGLRDVIRQVKETGLAVLLVEQNLPLALAVADTCYILSRGRIVHQGSAEDLGRDESVRRQHLGV